MEKAKTMTVIMNESREAFGKVVEVMAVDGFEFLGKTEKGFLFSDSNEHFVTVSVTAHKWETETQPAYDGIGMLEQYQDKQKEKVTKKAEAEALKAKKIAEKEAKKK